MFLIAGTHAYDGTMEWWQLIVLLAILLVIWLVVVIGGDFL